MEGCDIGRRHPPLQQVGLWVLHLSGQHMTSLNQFLEMASIAQTHTPPKGRSRDGLGETFWSGDRVGHLLSQSIYIAYADTKPVVSVDPDNPAKRKLARKGPEISCPTGTPFRFFTCWMLSQPLSFTDNSCETALIWSSSA